ncbi:hypothetical protein ACQRCA_05175 [Collinsella sp. SGI.095]|uniref:hypothetical protein n=1 Tax=Collinsella sp. SGI.095 TaxID=3420553 RepID=UPI003CFD6F80
MNGKVKNLFDNPPCFRVNQKMECSALAACAKFRKVTWAMLLFSADTLADPHKYQEREWGKTSISIALELALDAVLSVVEE